jgi:probable rRNA maturation factor
MNSRINFFNEDIIFLLRNKTLIRQWINEAGRKEGFSVKELNFIFCSDSFLYGMNTHYLHRAYFTDVITFNNSIQKDVIAGDIFISIQRVKENGKLFKTTFQDELHRVMIHGVLHLVNYKDKDKSGKVVMRKREDYYLSLRTF